MKAWFSRWKRYPGSCFGHIAWGALAGYVGGADGLALFMGGLAYQFGSGWRKQQAGEIDSVGLDSFDYAVGFAIGLGVRKALAYVA